jgi:hypothetical protein
VLPQDLSIVSLSCVVRDRLDKSAVTKQPCPFCTSLVLITVPLQSAEVKCVRFVSEDMRLMTGSGPCWACMYVMVRNTASVLDISHDLWCS